MLNSKIVIGAFLQSIAVICLAQSAPHKLQCWDSQSVDSFPILEADIVAENTLQTIMINQQYFSVGPNTVGEDIGSESQFYKGDKIYSLLDGASLVLPADLSNNNLISVYEKGLGPYRNENGAVFDYRQNEFSNTKPVRLSLRCQTDFN
jgi:hypothetical protein